MTEGGEVCAVRKKMVIFEKITVKSIAVSKIVITFAIEFRTRGVAQLVSAPRSGRGGRKFESSHPDQLELKMLKNGVLSSFFLVLPCQNRVNGFFFF